MDRYKIIAPTPPQPLHPSPSHPAKNPKQILNCKQEKWFAIDLDLELENGFKTYIVNASAAIVYFNL